MDNLILTSSSKKKNHSLDNHSNNISSLFSVFDIFLLKKLRYVSKLLYRYIKFQKLYLHLKGILGQKKKRITPAHSNTNYPKEMKLVPINIQYNLLQFNSLKFALGIHTTLIIQRKNFLLKNSH